jgi:hypothetical protein
MYSPGSVHIFSCSRKADRSWKYINLSQIYECRNWETEHYNSVLEITVLFLGIHNWEPDIYIGFSSAFHLQCSPCYMNCTVHKYLENIDEMEGSQCVCVADKEDIKEQPTSRNLSATAARVLQCTWPVATSRKYFSATGAL